MYSKPGSPTDVLKVTHVRERTFSDEDFVIAGCTVQNAEIVNDLETLTPEMKKTLRAENYAKVPTKFYDEDI